MDPTQQGLKLFALWLLIFVRFAGFVVQAPIWGSHHFDKKILVASAAVWSCIVYPSMTVPEISFEPITYILMIAVQLLVGMVIGYASFMIMSAAQFAGEMLDTQMGLSVAASYDPASGSSVNMMRRLKFYLAMTLFLVFDGHHKLIETMFLSFKVIPVTGLNYNGDLINQLIVMSSEIFYLGVQLASPTMAALFTTQIGLGMLARVAPQMNVFMLSFPLNIAIGLTVLGAALLLIINALHKLFDINNEQIIQVIKTMRFLPKGG